MKKWIMTVKKIEEYTGHIEIEAETLAQAESMAMDDAEQGRIVDWSFDLSTYEPWMTEEIEEET